MLWAGRRPSGSPWLEENIVNEHLTRVTVPLGRMQAAKPLAQNPGWKVFLLSG